jgi:hypothetical protein
MLAMIRETLPVIHTSAAWIHPLAYLDPGSGSYLIQLLIAGVLGALFALRMSWSRVKAFFLRLLGKESEDDDSQR